MSVNAFTPSVPLRAFHTRARLAPALSPRILPKPYVSRARVCRVQPRAAAPSHTSHTTAAVQDTSAHRLTPAARARTLVNVCNTGTLCTASHRHDGAPFGSHVDYVLDADGRPIFLLANGAAHTKNLGLDKRCSLFVQPPSDFGQDACRVTLVGHIAPLPEEQLDASRDAYIHVHSHAADALQYPDLFKFYTINLHDVFFVAGYGVQSLWVDVNEFCDAEADPLAHDAPAIVRNLNETKKDDLRRLCKVFLGDPDPKVCKMAALDRLGFDMRVKDSSGAYREYRVAFREVVSNRFDVQSALIKAFQEAWEKENGYDETWAGEDMRPTLLYYATPLEAS